MFSLIIQNDVAAPTMTSPLFALLIAELSLHELPASGSMIADFLVGVGVFESRGADTLGVRLVGDGVLGVAWISFVSSLPHDQ